MVGYHTGMRQHLPASKILAMPDGEAWLSGRDISTSKPKYLGHVLLHLHVEIFPQLPDGTVTDAGGMLYTENGAPLTTFVLPEQSSSG